MKYIETGEIVSTHGIKGDVKIYPWTDYPEFLEDFVNFYILRGKAKYKKLTATNVRTQNCMNIASFEGYDTVEKSRELVGCTLYLDRDEIELEEGYYFVADLIGCTVVNDETDKEIGKIYDVKNLGASDIYYIKGKDGKEYLFPAVDEFKVSTDIENKVIRVKVIEGMFGED